MKIAVDISQIVHAGSGVARYTENLIHSILTYDKKHSWIFFFASLRGRIPHTLEKEMQRKHRLVKIPLPPMIMEPLWNRARIMPIERFTGDVDVVISSDWMEAPAVDAQKMTIVHDLVYLKYPETLHPTIVEVQKRRMEWVKKETDLILADSLSTKQDLIDLLKIDASKIEVLYPSVAITPPSETDQRRVLNKYAVLDGSYILTVGKLEPRKNISRLIKAFQKAQLKNVTLLIVGPDGWDNMESKVVGEVVNVRFLGFVPDEDLYALYRGALFFVYPSIYEGFGFPVAEAMVLNVSVATSNTSSLLELGQYGGELFDPFDVDAISRTLIKMHDNPTLRASHVQSAQQFVKKLSAKHFYQEFEACVTRLDRMGAKSVL